MVYTTFLYAVKTNMVTRTNLYQYMLYSHKWLCSYTCGTIFNKMLSYRRETALQGAL